MESYITDVPLDASKVLAAALEQMDDIIAATTYELENSSSTLHSPYSASQCSSYHTVCSDTSSALKVPHSDSSSMSKSSINKLLDLLKELILSKNDTNDNYMHGGNLNVSSAEVVFKWLQNLFKETEDNQAVHSDDGSNLQKIRVLEIDKKNLVMQASVLSEQIDAQSIKISELEKLLEKTTKQLRSVENDLNQETLTRSAVENSKLELMSELSKLRLRLAATEQSRKDCDERCKKFENELVFLHARLNEKELEYYTLKNKTLPSNETFSMDDKSPEIEKLQHALGSVMVSNSEKDRQIENLRLSLNKYKKLQEFVLTNQTRKESESSVKDNQLDGDCCSDYVTSSSLGNEFLVSDEAKANPSSSTPNQCESCVLKWKESQCSPISMRSSPAAFYKCSSAETVAAAAKDASQKNPFASLPRQSEAPARPPPEMAIPREGARRAGVSFASNECTTIPQSGKENTSDNLPLPPQPYLIRQEKDKSKRFLKIFSKWKRSGSQDIVELKRGGVRATAGPRLGWSLEPKQTPFASWDVERVSQWLHDTGLGAYAAEGQRADCTGQKLLDATPQQLEKSVAESCSKNDAAIGYGANLSISIPVTNTLPQELGVKHPLHRKKVLLGARLLGGRLPGLPRAVAQLDSAWVLRWLDDVGLPQHKDAFAEARVDGCVLHHLTVDDLLSLKVISQLHHVSIRCGIRVLRENNFDPHCLVRRSLPDECQRHDPERVTLWTNHRIMEWLRTVDLSEYAPNLRGSGVHGGLIIYEPKFNPDLFATLLNIPPSKTLLRRHLTTHFKSIVGSELVLLKRSAETDQTYTPLSPSVKIKSVRKGGQFSMRRKRPRGEGEPEEFVCPMDVVARPAEASRLVVRRNSDPAMRGRTPEGNLSRCLEEAPRETTEGKGLEDSPTSVV